MIFAPVERRRTDMFEFIVLLFAVWLFIKFLQVTFHLARGVLKISFALIAILLWPLSLIFLFSMGILAAALPVIVICGIADLCSGLSAR